MPTKSIAIVGGGLAGLSAGIFARLCGLEAHVFEQHSLPGGVCTSWKRKDFLIDGCLHWLMGANPDSSMYRIYEQVGALDGMHLKVLHHFGRFTWLDEKGQSVRSMDITSNLDQMLKDWRNLSPQDAQVFDILGKGIRAFQDYRADWDATEEGAGWWARLKMLWTSRKQFSYFGSYRMPVEKFAEQIQDPFVRWQITNSFVPQMPVFFLFMVLGELTGGRLARIEESSLAFAQALAKRLESLGGKISYRADVDKILVENDRAVGLRLVDGTEHRADITVSAADGHSTIFKLLGGRYADAAIRKRYETHPLFEPIVIVSFGVNRSFPGEPSAHSIKQTCIVNTGDCPQDMFYYKIFNENPSFAPSGKTVVQAILRAKYDIWEKLSADRVAYDREKQRISEEVLGCLEPRYPGISTQVEMTDVASPMTYIRYTRNYHAAWEGWLMTPQAFMERIPKTLPGLSGFYMAGQWVQPGGGIPTVILSGRSVIRKICRAEGRIFPQFT